MTRSILAVFTGTMANGKPVKEATFRIEAEGYGAPVTIKVRYPKRKARKTVRFKHKDERTDG